MKINTLETSANPVTPGMKCIFVLPVRQDKNVGKGYIILIVC